MNKKGNLRKTDTRFLRHFVEQNGPTTLQQLHSVLHMKIEAENVISLKKLQRDLQRHETMFTFLPSGLVGPNEARLTAVEKIVQFLEVKGPSSIHDVRKWYFQHASKEEKGALNLSKKPARVKKSLRKFPHIFHVEEDKVAVHPNYLHEKFSLPMSCNKNSSHTHPVTDSVIEAGTEINMCVKFSEDTDTLSTTCEALAGHYDRQEQWCNDTSTVEYKTKSDSHLLVPSQMMKMSSDPPDISPRNIENEHATEPYLIGLGEEQLHPTQTEDCSSRDDPLHDVNFYLPRFGDDGRVAFACSGQEASIKGY